MKINIQGIIDTITEANRSYDGFAKFGEETILPWFEYNRYLASPLAWSNHQVALKMLQVNGVEQGFISCNGGGIDILIHPNKIKELSESLIKKLFNLEMTRRQSDMGALDESHYYSTTVEHFESKAFENYENIKKFYPSWEQAHWAMYNWGDYFSKNVDGTFPLSDEFSDTYAFEAYVGVLIKHKTFLETYAPFAEVLDFSNEDFVSALSEFTHEYDFCDLEKFDTEDETVVSFYSFLTAKLDAIIQDSKQEKLL